MATLTPETPTDRTTLASPWLRVLAWLAAVVATTDLIFLAMIGEVVPPLAAGLVLTALGLLLLRTSRRAAIVVLGLTSLVLLVGNVPFAVDHFAHPASAIDFTHAVVGTVGRALAVVAAVGAWRRAGAAGARRLAVGSAGLAALTVVVAGIAMVTSSGEDPAPGDVEVPVEAAAFPATIEVDAGGTLFLDNRDLFRHTFTVEGEDLDVELPAAHATRSGVDLPAGTYPVICAVPGHEAMEATLHVR